MEFKVERRLLNPKFESYKLQTIRQEDAVSRFELSRKPTQATTSTRVPLTFEEMRSRIGHNHLAVESNAGLVVYVDGEYNVCLIGLPTTIVAKEDLQPTFRVLYEMATPVDSEGVRVQKEYPSAAFLGPSAVAVSDGNGLLYVLPIKDEQGPTQPVGIFTLRTGGAVNSPFKIHYCHRVSPITVILLLSSRHYPKGTNTSQSPVQFDIWAVKIELLSLRVNSQERELEVYWHRRGRDVPFYTAFIEEAKSYLVLGGSSYPDANTIIKQYYEPATDEMAPIPRQDEQLGGANQSQIDDLVKPPKPHPYSWTQADDAVTIAFPLPSTTSKTDIKVLFTIQTLTLHVNSALPRAADGSVAYQIPHYTTKQFWDFVNPTSCFWTWDKEAEHSYGLLTLHMEKKHEDTRWMQVFAAGKDSDDEVPESVDPSEMVKIRESMEKWTSALAMGEDASGLGLGSGIPSLMEGEMDEEADAQVGRKVMVTWIGERGTTPEWTKKSAGDEHEQWEDAPITLLSTPIPGSVMSMANLQLVLKQDLDGAVFTLTSADSRPAWKHTSTYPALSFVLASKQDTRFTHHLPSIGVLAFEGGSLRDRGANVYIFGPAKGKEVWAKQSVLQVGNGGGGAVLGVGYIKLSGGQDDGLLICLTESQLVVINTLFEDTKVEGRSL